MGGRGAGQHRGGSVCRTCTCTGAACRWGSRPPQPPTPPPTHNRPPALCGVWELGNHVFPHRRWGRGCITRGKQTSADPHWKCPEEAVPVQGEQGDLEGSMSLATLCVFRRMPKSCPQRFPHNFHNAPPVRRQVLLRFCWQAVCSSNLLWSVIVKNAGEVCSKGNEAAGLDTAVPCNSACAILSRDYLTRPQNSEAPKFSCPKIC